jgi:hypothetical protein
VLYFNYNTKIEVGKTAEEYILPVKKKQITDNKKPVLKAPLLLNLVISGGFSPLLSGCEVYLLFKYLQK